jgi:Zn-dependent alcohol dehydrogenase
MSVTRRANVRPGDSVAVFGCGGVGLSAVQGAHLVSAWPIIAVDPLPEKRRLAVDLGATHVIDPVARDPVATIRGIICGGVDYAFEASGRPDVGRQAFDSTRQGGTTVLVGQAAVGIDASVPVYEVTQFEHTLLGSNLGAAVPALDVPRLARLLGAGRLDLDTLVTHRFALDEVNDALALLDESKVGRAVLEIS